MDQSDPGKPREIEPWERDLVDGVAHRFDTSDREELQAELARTLLLMKANPPKGIRNWKKYLAKLLLNRASNWVNSQRRERRNLSILASNIADEPVAGFITEDALPIPAEDNDRRVAFTEMWEGLDPELRQLWTFLLEEDGNQVAVARRLGKHRNTVRLWIRRIHAALKRHGFRDTDWS